jgi:hypothetical protein
MTSESDPALQLALRQSLLLSNPLLQTMEISKTIKGVDIPIVLTKANALLEKYGIHWRYVYVYLYPPYHTGFYFLFCFFFPLYQSYHK